MSRLGLLLAPAVLLLSEGAVNALLHRARVEMRRLYR